MHDLARGAALADEERGVVKQATPVHAVELGGHVEAVDVLLGLDLSPQGAHDREPTQPQLPIDRHVAQAVAHVRWPRRWRAVLQPETAKQTAFDILDRCYEPGRRTLDIADVDAYGPGHSEKLLGDWMVSKPEGFLPRRAGHCGQLQHAGDRRPALVITTWT